MTGGLHPELSIQRIEAHEWELYRALRLRALGDAPDAFGRTLEEEAAFPDAQWEARVAGAADGSRSLPLFGRLSGEPVALAWGRIEASAPEDAHVYQMWVAPEARRSGVGRALLQAIIDWAVAENARSLLLGVTSGDSPATRLYTAAGFEPTGAPEPLRPDSGLLAQAMTLRLESRR